MKYFVALKSLRPLHKEGVTLSAFAEHLLCDLHDRQALTRLHKLKVEEIDEIDGCFLRLDNRIIPQKRRVKKRSYKY